MENPRQISPLDRNHSLIPDTVVLEKSALSIPGRNVILRGDLALPRHAKGVILFAHGSGSSRFSPRNRFVAEMLHEHGLGTLLTDLLTPEEEEIDREMRHLRFNIPLLAERLSGITDWTERNPDTMGLDIGYFGASTGAAAALMAAARHPGTVRAIVSRGGRPDLAGDYLPQMTAPTLLIVGERDPEVMTLNSKALAKLTGTITRLDVVPGATHLFEEPGALAEAAELAAAWFEKYMGPLLAETE
jgi:pimeloyl-ACP methyl ester carboxylesterase